MDASTQLQRLVSSMAIDTVVHHCLTSCPSQGCQWMLSLLLLLLHIIWLVWPETQGCNSTPDGARCRQLNQIHHDEWCAGAAGAGI